MQLNFKKTGEGFPLIILHGLLGSLDNWQGIAKKLAEEKVNAMGLAVYIIDQRNHGKSPHTSDFSYDLLSADLLEFFEHQQISKAHIMGHSMGGKTAMKFALEHPGKTDKLIVVDIAPAAYEDDPGEIFNALFAAKVSQANSREEVEKVLRSYLGDDKTLVGFLMKGLDRDADAKHFEWKFNAQALWKNYPNIAAAIESPKPFTGKALFIKGEKSDYINASNYPGLIALFPNAQLVEIAGAGHWVHADKPAEFIKTVLRFLE
jgi:esterase